MAKNTNYVSDATIFINDLVQKRPYLREQQETLRKTWWDKEEQEVVTESQLDKENINPDSYAYFSYPQE
jgi:hypothetical protein